MYNKTACYSDAPDVFEKGTKKAEDTNETVYQLHAKIGQ
jgi:hypothetical protein